MTVRRVAIVLNPGLCAAGLAAALDVFAAANRTLAPSDRYVPVLLGRACAPVTASNGLRVMPDATLAEAAGPFDLVLTFGGDPAAPAVIGRSPAGRPVSAAIAATLARIAADPRAAGSVSRMAAQAGMSPRSFARSFVRQVGTTPRACVEAARLARARDLMVSGDRPLKAIAFECGFASADRLRLAFVRRFGMPPSAYRAAVQARRRVAEPAQTGVAPARFASLDGRGGSCCEEGGRPCTEAVSAPW